MSSIIKRITERIQHGRETDFQRLVRLYENDVMRFILRLEPNVADAEELTPDVLLAAYTSMGSFRGDSNIRTWLLGIAYRTTITHLRHRGAEIVYIEDNDTLLSRVADKDVDKSLNDDSEEQIERLMKAIDLLTPEDRTLIIEHYLEERPMKEVAQILDIEYGTAVTRLHRIRKKLYLIINQLQDYER